MIAIFYITLAIVILLTIFTIFQATSGKLLGAVIDEIGVFIGPSLFKFKIGGLNFSFNVIPLGSYVKFTDDFEHFAPIRKLLILISGLVFYLVIAILFTGFTETFRQTFIAYQQVFLGAISPVSGGAKYIEMLVNIMTQQSFLTGLGILASKFLAVMLIPLGTFAGGQVIIYLLELAGFKSEKFNERFGLIGLLVWLIITIPWIIAGIIFSLRSLGMV